MSDQELIEKTAEDPLRTIACCLLRGLRGEPGLGGEDEALLQEQEPIFCSSR